MGKSKSKGLGSEDAAEEEEEKAQPVAHPLVDISSEGAERKAQAGAVSSGSTLVPAPAPRKRGRPRKVVPKVEDAVQLEMQQSTAPTSTEVESKKLKSESPSSTRNGTSSKNQALSDVKVNTRAPLRREGSRRKSEPRRAAD